MTYNFHS